MKEIYPVVVVTKAAYAFLDRVYVHIDEADEKNWRIQMKLKPGFCDEHIQEEFENELLAQTVRLNVFNQTHEIRELLMARAFSSSMVEDEEKVEKINSMSMDISDSELDDILTDWFSKS